MNKILRIAVSATAACAALIAVPSHAQQQGAVTFKVPYKFSNIPVSQYDSFLIICAVSKGSESIGAGNAKLPLDANGSASGSADVVVKATVQGKLLSDATDWNCRVEFSQKGATNTFEPAYKLAKPGTPLAAGHAGKF